MRALAIDYGDTRIGLALSDLTMTLAGKTLTIRGESPDRAAS